MKRSGASRERSKESNASAGSEVGAQGSVAGTSDIGTNGGNGAPKRGAAAILAAAKKLSPQNFQSSGAASVASSTSALHGGGHSQVRFQSNRSSVGHDSSSSPFTSSTGIVPSTLCAPLGDTLISGLSDKLEKLGDLFTLNDLVEAGVLSEGRAMQYAAEKVGTSARSVRGTVTSFSTHVPSKQDRLLSIWDLSELICRKDFCAWGDPDPNQVIKRMNSSPSNTSIAGDADDGGSAFSSTSETSESSDNDKEKEEAQARKVSVFHLPSSYRARGMTKGQALWKRGALKVQVATCYLRPSPSSDQAESPGAGSSLLDVLEQKQPKRSIRGSVSPSSEPRGSTANRRSLKRGSRKQDAGEAGSPRSPSASPRTPRLVPPTLATPPPRGERPRECCPPVEGTWVPAACGGLGSVQNPQVQIEAQRLTWIRADLQVEGNCGSVIQIWVLGRSRWGLRRPTMAHVLTKAESTGDPLGPRQLRCEYELPPGEVSTLVLCCSSADGIGKKHVQEEAPPFKLCIISSLPFSRMPALLLPRKPVSRASFAKQRLQKRMTQKLGVISAFGQARNSRGSLVGKKENPYRKGCMCPICGKPADADIKEADQKKESGAPGGSRVRRSSGVKFMVPDGHKKEPHNKYKAKDEAERECVTSCPNRCVCWIWRDVPPAPEKVAESADTAQTRPASKAKPDAGVEFFSARCIDAAEDSDLKITKFLKDVCAGYSRTTQLFFTKEAKRFFQSKSEDAATPGLSKRSPSNGLQARNSPPRLTVFDKRRQTTRVSIYLG